jgi:prolyl 4-hydroxylase
MTSQEEVLALYTSAMETLSGAHGDPTTEDMMRVAADLQKASAQSPLAKSRFGLLMLLGAGITVSKEQAIELYVDAAMSGMPKLARELGACLLVAGNADGLAASLLRHAAKGGDWIAVFLILREAMRGRYLATKDELQSLVKLMSAGVPFQPEMTAAINTLGTSLAVTPPASFQKQACLDALTSILVSEISTTPVDVTDQHKIQHFPSLLQPVECDYLVAIASEIMQPSKVVDASAAQSINAGYRTSDEGAILPYLFDMPLIGIMQKLAAACGTPLQNCEFLSMLRYRQGQEYRPHHDYLEVDENDYSKVTTCGQRTTTLLTYLNENFDGGETAFPELDISFKGKTGDSLLFANTDENGNGIPSSLHAGCPVQNGEKWLATLWVREKAFWPWAQ